MPTSLHPPTAPATLPPLVAAYVEATNSFDLERLLATFADDALVNDQLRDYWGKSAIREWAAHDIIGERLTMDVTGVVEHHEATGSATNGPACTAESFPPILPIKEPPL